MSTECTQALNSGEPCNAPARNGSNFCRHHDPSRLAKLEQIGQRESEPFELPPLHNKCSILAAVNQVLDALAQRRIQCSEARTLLLGLKFAHRLMTELDQESHASLASVSESHSKHPQPSAHPAPSRKPEAGRPSSNPGSRMTPAELQDFTQRFQKAAVQKLHDQIAGPATKRTSEIFDYDRALAVIAACSDPLMERRPSAL